MDYKKKYKEEVVRATQLWECGDITRENLEYIFPELKESEDERISKQIISFLKEFERDHYRNLDFSSWIAWLEKQGESTDINPSEFDLRLNKLLKQFETLSKEELASSLSFYLNVVQNDGTYKAEEKQGEQPRYSIGDVLCDKSCTTLNKDAQPNFEITDIRNGMYICDKCSFPISQQDEYELVAKKPYGQRKECEDCQFSYVGECKGDCALKRNEQKSADKIEDEEYNGEDYGIDSLFHAQRILEKTLGKVDGYQTDDGILAHQCAISAVKKLYEQKPVSITDEWIEDYWQHEKVNNPYSYDKGEEIQFDHQGFVRFCKKYCKKPAEWSKEDIRNIDDIDSVLFYDKDLSEDTCVRLRNWLESLKPIIEE